MDLIGILSNLYVQIAVPFLLLSILLILLMKKRKAVSSRNVIICIAAIVITVTCAYLGVKNLIIKGGTISKQAVNNQYIAYEMMLSGQYETANDIIEELCEQNANNKEAQLLDARLAVLEGNMSKASLLYEVAKELYSGKSGFPEDEYKNVSEYVEYNNTNSDESVIAFLKSQGKNPEDYGYTTTASVESESKSDIVDSVKDALEEEEEEFVKNNDIDNNIAVYVAKVEKMYDEYILSSNCDSEDAQKAIKKITKAIENDTKLANNKYVRLARVKALTLTADYEKIAQYADENSCIEELMIISELYIKGYINEDSFSEDFANIDTDKYEKVIKQCNSILDSDAMNEISESDKKIYQEEVEMLNLSLKKEALVTVLSEMEDKVDASSSTIKSKVYLQMSKVSQYCSMEKKAEECLDKAMATSSDVNDVNYSQPMGALNEIASGNSSTDSVKSIADYVNQVIDNSLPYMVINLPSLETYEDEGSYESSDENENSEESKDSEDDEKSDSHEDSVFGNMFSSFNNEEEVSNAGGFKYLCTRNNKSNNLVQVDTTNNNSTTTSMKESFSQFFTNSVSEKTAAINIGVINKDNFPKVKTRIQVQSDQINSESDFKSLVTIKDCNRVVDYSVKKVNYSKSKIILLCDVSGSMSGSIGDLQNAVRSFANNLNSNEEVCVIAFSDSIKYDSGFTSDKGEAAKAADHLGDGGGTNMYEPLLSLGSKFNNDVNCNNIIILMTDGEDNNPASKESIYTDVPKLAANSACTVYTVGLGSSIDTEYLTDLSNAGGGSFLYVDQAASIDNFFNYIHQQTQNQFVIEYEAKDTVTNNRILRAEIQSESIAKEKTYYLVEPDYSQNQNALDPSVLYQSSIQVYGLETKTMYKTENDFKTKLLGSGFSKDMDVSMRLTGSMIDYTLSCSFKSETEYEVTIPYGVAAGTYTLEVTIDDEIHSLKDEFTVLVPGTQKNFQYGDYSFTCENSETDGNGNLVLSGNVIMNGWLHFKGNVSFSGDIENSECIEMTDSSGSYVPYSKMSCKQGLTKLLAEKGVSANFAPFGSFRIYKAPYNPNKRESFEVDDIANSSVVNLVFLILENGTLSLYPDTLFFDLPTINFKFPFQDQLLGDGFADDIKNMKYEAGIIITGSTIGVDASFDYSIPEVEEGGKQIRMALLPMWLDTLKVDIDTYKNNYTIGAGVRFKSIPKMESLGLEFSVLDGYFDGLCLSTTLDKGISVMKTPVPISLNDLEVGFSGCSALKKKGENIDIGYILGLKLKAGFNMDVAKVTDVLPDLAEFLDLDKKKDDIPPVIEFADCKIETVLKEFDFGFDSKMKFLGKYDFGTVEINLGKFNYSNELLGMKNTNEYGVRAKVKIGHEWKTTNLSLDLNGSLELVAGYPYTGVWGAVSGDFDIKWWILSYEKDIAGDLLLGINVNSNNELQFNGILRGQKSNGKYVGFRATVSMSQGFDVSKY